MPQPAARRRRLPNRFLLTLALGIFDLVAPLTLSGSDFEAGAQESVVASDDGELGPAYKWRPTKYWPTIFVAILSRRSAGPRRALIRKAWERADLNQGKLLTRFALCEREDDGLGAGLQAENETYGDLMIMNCSEGYGQGRLTKKTLAAMQTYSESPVYSQQQLFMKIDDDTFAAWTRLWPLVAKAWENSTDRIYMGTLKGPTKPSRDPFNAFYEPRDVYSGELYPKSADGGPGYILGGSLVRQIISERIGEHWLLYNEDKAVAVWVDGLVQRGEAVNYVNIEGQTGYARTSEEWEGQLRWFHKGRWMSYPLLLHHRLSGAAIECLSEVEALKDPDAPIDKCFTSDDNTWIPMQFMKQADDMGFEMWLKIHQAARANATKPIRLDAGAPAA